MVMKASSLMSFVITFYYHMLVFIPYAYNRPYKSCYFKSSVCSQRRLNDADVRVLLEVRDGLSSDRRMLEDWNANRTCANGWSGVCTDINGRVTELDISGDFEFWMPSSFSNLTKLKYANFGTIRFAVLPNFFGNLPALSYLDLSRSNLYGYAIDVVSSIKSLTTLVMQDMIFLGDIPPSVGNFKNLKYLDLRSNSLKYLPSTFGSLSTLVELNLDSNSFNESVIEPISKLKNLAVLRLSGNVFNLLPSKISLLSSLTYLDLWGNFMDGTIPSSFGNLKKLEYLDLSVNSLCGSFPTAFKNSTRLKYLKTIDTCLSEELKNGRIYERDIGYECEIICDPVPNYDPYEFNSVTQSSVYLNGIPKLAVDGWAGKGKFSSQSCMHSRNQIDPYFLGSFYSEKVVKTVQIYNRLDCCSSKLDGVQVYVGKSGTHFSAAGNVACKDPKFKYNKSQKGFPLNVTCNLRGKYVWVVVPGERKILSICEIVVL